MNMPNLILLHGALGSSKQLIPLKELLDEHFYCHSYNFSGHGGKAITTPYSIESFSNELITLYKEKQLDSAYIVGYSMGGYVALHFAMQHPEKVKAIHTLGTKFGWSPEIAANEVKMLNPSIIEKKIPSFAKALEQRHHPENWKKVMQETANMMTELGKKQPLSLDEFTTIKIPTLISIGNADTMVSIEESQRVAEQLPNCKFSVFDGFKHPVEQVDIRILAESIIQFFNEH